MKEAHAHALPQTAIILLLSLLLMLFFVFVFFNEEAKPKDRLFRNIKTHLGVTVRVDLQVSTCELALLSKANRVVLSAKTNQAVLLKN